MSWQEVAGWSLAIAALGVAAITIMLSVVVGRAVISNSRADTADEGSGKEMFRGD